MKPLTQRAQFLSFAPSSVINETSYKLRQQGVDVISLDVGEPDFDTPENVRIAGKNAIDNGYTRYTEIPGMLKLREIICEKLWKENGLRYHPQEIDVCVGAKQAVFNGVMAVCDPGDEMIIPWPCWVSYADMVRLAGGIPVLVPTNLEDFSLNLANIESAITEKTKGVIICTPNNPTGAVYAEKSLHQLAELARQYDLYIITDEVYEKFVYDGAKHFSVAASSDDARQRTITINGLSKAFAMTGWRVGYLAAPETIVKITKSLQNRETSSTSTISQMASIEALSGKQEEMKQMCAAFRERRAYMYQRLNSIPGLACQLTNGAFYLMPQVRSFYGKSCNDYHINNDVDLANYLLGVGHVALSPGTSYNAPGYIRFTYAQSLENIRIALDRIEGALANLE